MVSLSETTPNLLVCQKRRVQCRQVIQHTTQGPNVGGSTVRLLLINLGTDEIGGPHLCLHVPPLGHLGDVHISNLHTAMLIDQTIGRF